MQQLLLAFFIIRKFPEQSPLQDEGERRNPVRQIFVPRRAALAWQALPRSQPVRLVAVRAHRQGSQEGHGQEGIRHIQVYGIRKLGS